jgi:hypothetical protein
MMGVIAKLKVKAAQNGGMMWGTAEDARGRSDGRPPILKGPMSLKRAYEIAIKLHRRGIQTTNLPGDLDEALRRHVHSYF